MCTVSFVAANDKIIITSNRDEAVLRPALKPAEYLVNGRKILFPRDPQAGGTWFATNEKSDVIVLLNGAAEKHKHLFNYRKSRGLIVLDLISSESAIQTWREIDLDNIEPFTLVLFESGKLYQLRWDFSEKETVVLDTAKNYVWSSSTLYPNEIREKRSQWFYSFLETKSDVNENEMFNFHRYTEDKNPENGLVIDRNGQLKTLSITQAVIENQSLKMMHFDLIDQTESSHFIIV